MTKVYNSPRKIMSIHDSLVQSPLLKRLLLKVLDQVLVSGCVGSSSLEGLRRLSKLDNSSRPYTMLTNIRSSTLRWCPSQAAFFHYNY
jgi:hypothetical protein